MVSRKKRKNAIFDDEWDLSAYQRLIRVFKQETRNIRKKRKKKEKNQPKTQII